MRVFHFQCGSTRNQKNQSRDCTAFGRPVSYTLGKLLVGPNEGRSRDGLPKQCENSASRVSRTTKFFSMARPGIAVDDAATSGGISRETANSPLVLRQGLVVPRVAPDGMNARSFQEFSPPVRRSRSFFRIVSWSSNRVDRDFFHRDGGASARYRTIASKVRRSGGRFRPVTAATTRTGIMGDGA